MKNFFWLIICTLINTSVQVYAQDSTSVNDSTIIDSIKILPKAKSSDFDDNKVYVFKNLIRSNFGGYAQAVKFNMNQQMFDFMEMGRPQFVAPLNLFPHQSTYIVNKFSVNEYTNGMFNTRFLSADQIDNVDYSVNPFATNSVVINPVQINEEQAYTRLKYFEGDVGYSDLDIFFVRELGKDVKIQLAGFNKGYAGLYSNSGHTGLAYNTKLFYRFNESLEAEFSWLRNHEVSGMQSPLAEEDNFTYQADAQRFGLQFSYKNDSTSNDKITLGLLSGYNFHRNRSEADKYSARQISDNSRLFLSKDFTDSSYALLTTFRLDNHLNYGSAFEKKFSETIFSFNTFLKYNFNRDVYLQSSAETSYLKDFNPVFGFSSSFNLLHSNMFTQIKAGFDQRLPNPVERAVSYKDYRGNKKLNSETLLNFSILEKWQVVKSFSLQAEIGYSEIHDEISFENNTFKNSNKRSWTYLNGQGQLKFWMLALRGGGQLLSADEYISPKQILWGEATFHGNFFNGTIILDLTVFNKWSSVHNLIYYDPMINRFYSGNGENGSNTNVGFKAVWTVSDAEIFMEMDNLLSHEILYIENYSRDTRRVRFGVNWVLWD